MNWASQLSRDDLLENVEYYRNDPDFIAFRDNYLDHAVQSKDLRLVRALLDAGAGPDVFEPWGDTLQHYLVHEYCVLHSTQGRVVLEILELLLSRGADPEHVGSNNLRAIDLAMRTYHPELTDLFIRFGANHKPREQI
jgi:ankyrin repeat protein